MIAIRKAIVLITFIVCSRGASAGVYDDMIVAARNDDAAKIISLIERGMDANTADTNGTTLTMYAARVGNDKLLGYLLAHRASARLKNRFGDSALSLASLEGRTECVATTSIHRPEPGLPLVMQHFQGNWRLPVT